ncbi:wall-associated receptor kinase 4 [Quercus suber]|uniref:Wall-associated receptor kinase 4 n=1 Tax=Quercus suber TaxID=58331 RepID=A0AAW0LF95_QUESU
MTLCKIVIHLPLGPSKNGVGIGFIVVLFCSSWLYLIVKQRKLIKLKQRFFEQNGGLILQQKLSKQENSTAIAKIFTKGELQKATNNYDETLIIGWGGFGTVYKGILPDNRIVAIKKSKTVDENQIEQFINEVLVLSQINHRNVVKLLGCCLETQVPLLVYEFIPNGTLFEYIHHESKASTISWETRLRIAAETAEALSYLHFAASPPIIHRDVKSSNILLDSTHTAKVSDFGASRLVPLDQTQFATMVQGTLGYLDPEYMQTSQLTEKSDVYSFGVVLVELLTGKKALSFDRPEVERSLAIYFISFLKDNRLFEIVEKHVAEEGKAEQLKEVANLAKRCLRLKGEDRPTMKEVATELEGLRKVEMHSWVNVDSNSEETKFLLGETSDSYKYNASNKSTNVYDSLGTSFGALYLITITLDLFNAIKKRSETKLKKKFFKKNGGLLLQQQLSSNENNVQNKKLFNSKELEKAVDHFSENRIVSIGGQGTVFKGMLSDERIIAIKKVPLLVYEFIPNGTLFLYLHDENEEFPLTWNMRLRISIEIAGALFYLHSAAASPIYH